MIKKKPEIFANNIDEFIKGAEKKKPEIRLIRRTYYLTQELIDSVEAMAYHEKKDKSDIIREALEKYIPEKYKQKI